MLQPRANWNIYETDADQAEQLAKDLQIEPLLARLLIVRGIKSKENAAAFLHGGTDRTHDPFLLDGMTRAVYRVRQALERGEHIRVYGDYDADGVSSTALMVFLLRQLGASFDYYIPHRVREGYGLNKGAIEAAHTQGVTLLITVDTGISSVEEISYASELGIDVIVTDHHEPPAVLPQAYALINPKKPGCTYPFKQLAGVGVALKLAEALLGRWPEELLEFAALGTVADLMPLVDENRIIVKNGLARLKSTANPGFRALFGVAGIQPKDANAMHIGFALAPRINASGRLHNADDAVRLLITEDMLEAKNLADELDEMNKARQLLVEDITKQAMAMKEQHAAAGVGAAVIVVAQDDWNIGVVGIVASKLVDRFYRPAIVLGIDNETGLAKGSARSIAGFDIHKALYHCEDLLEHYGGHQAAAGMTLTRENVPELTRRLNALAEEWLLPEHFVPQMDADMVCSLEEVELKTIEQLEQLGPFGMGNPTPKFVLSDVRCQELRTMGKERQHMKLSLQCAVEQTAVTLDAVGFNKAAIIPWISPTASVDILGELTINEWNGLRKPQLMIQDIRISHVQLFDWRGAAKLDEKINEVAARLASHDGTQQAQLALLTLNDRDEELRSRFGGQFAIWGIERPGGDGVVPRNELASQQSPTAITDIVLYDLPADLATLAAAARAMEGAQRFYAVFQGELVNVGNLPTRDMFKTVYAAVHRHNGGLSSGAFTAALSKRSGLSADLIQFMLDVFIELGLIRRTNSGYETEPVKSTGKKELSSSALYQQRQSMLEVEQALLYSTTDQLHQWILNCRQPIKPLMEDIV
ncbi:single-stranded-DNA-specific exonuclease RecJ [Paenibacillus xerothermodurans]|uniref:Single-stranded-DNA-specific exonuclease RecJ n=1 Tax=Paenibacillus xerothermodurans TaxID=1977292 RepID=A0A2W1NX80_PAEXE|nr:single-stranded-DNA-specific exonuclease RecJ [Paenibacillus xerothermodurans]PZE19458.1 single-stranded-DNA-specific exonuclease RecJ [Paenibacillus xerothermodurans]